MITQPTSDDDALVACEVCIKEVPISVTMGEEAHDYFHHFCGLECFSKWHSAGEPPGDE